MEKPESDGPIRIDNEKYDELFEGDKRTNALDHALEIRKFEIDLYWRRSSYFWAFIGAALAAYGVAQQIQETEQRTHLSVVIAAIGLVFSVAWYCANRGSKQWQENWENHVDLLEDDAIGPLFKTVAGRPPARNLQEWLRGVISGPGSFSVSKINQIVSLFVTALWIPLLVRSMPDISLSAPVDWFITSVLLIAAAACCAIFWLGRTYQGNHQFSTTLRSSRVEAAVTASDTSTERGNDS